MKRLNPYLNARSCRGASSVVSGDSMVSLKNTCRLLQRKYREVPQDVFGNKDAR